MMLPRNVQLALLISVAVSLRSWSAPAAELPDPGKLGPYPVGVTTMVLVDHSRTDVRTKGPRSLITEVWYPAADSARDMPRNKFSDFLLRGQVPALRSALEFAFEAPSANIDEKYFNIAVRDAQVRDGKFPMIVFSHGNRGIRIQSTFWCDHMASHGYIVVACDHTGNAAVTAVNNQLILYNEDSIEPAKTDRPKDVSFLIDRMTRMNSGEDSRFAGRIDIKRIGAAGHSFGGYTVTRAIESDSRIKAIVPMASTVDDIRENFRTPVMMFCATEDATIELKGNERLRHYFDHSQGPRYLVEMRNAGHFSYSDMFQFKPEFGDGIGKGKRITKPGEEIQFLDMKTTYLITNSYSTAFFGEHVKGDKGCHEYLVSNHFPEEVDYKFFEPSPDSAAAGK